MDHVAGRTDEVLINFNMKKARDQAWKVEDPVIDEWIETDGLVSSIFQFKIQLEFFYKKDMLALGS